MTNEKLQTLEESLRNSSTKTDLSEILSSIKSSFPQDHKYLSQINEIEREINSLRANASRNSEKYKGVVERLKKIIEDLKSYKPKEKGEIWKTIKVFLDWLNRIITAIKNTIWLIVLIAGGGGAIGLLLLNSNQYKKHINESFLQGHSYGTNVAVVAFDSTNNEFDYFLSESLLKPHLKKFSNIDSVHTRIFNNSFFKPTFCNKSVFKQIIESDSNAEIFEKLNLKHRIQFMIFFEKIIIKEDSSPVPNTEFYTQTLRGKIFNVSTGFGRILNLKENLFNDVDYYHSLKDSIPGLEAASTDILKILKRELPIIIQKSDFN